VWAGWTVLNDQLIQLGDTHVKRFPDKGSVAIPAPDLDKGDAIVVGHNIGFDILHLCNRNNKHWRDWVNWLHDPRAKVWDTMAVEYRLLGQSESYPSMDSCAERRGWPLKPGRLKEYWEQGISTEDIPDEEVAPYMQHDADSTTRLFLDQVKQVRARDMMAIIRVENDALLATTLMKYTGMYFDKVTAMREYHDVLLPRVEALTEELKGDLERLTGIPAEYINPGSNPFLAKVLYGGDHKIEGMKAYILDDDGNYSRYKSGQKKGDIRYRNLKVTCTLPCRVTGKFEGTGEETLGKIKAENACDKDLAPVFDKVLELRGVSKLAKTYFAGYSGLTWPEDSCIHGNLNHCVTVTSRLSSSAPNLQNAGHTPIRKCFKSRYKGGHLLEVDLSQIEVVVQAFLSQDVQMINDIKEGVDFHSKRAAEVAGVTYETVRQGYLDEDPHWTKKRKAAKQFSFQRAYGAGAPAISASTGIPLKDVYSLIDAEERMYSGVKETNDQWIADVNHSVKVRDGVACGVFRSPTGTEFRFKREPDRRGRMSIKPTIVKNYPIQGMAADIIKLILARLRGYLWDFNRVGGCVHDEQVLLVNTVHDSVIFDVPSGVDMPTLAKGLIELFTTGVLADLKDRLGVDFNVPIKADAEAGKNWYHYDEDDNPDGMHGVDIAA
jgi:DNA polymerase I-like protein with 3'-5' exonuclease and polymerase domains